MQSSLCSASRNVAAGLAAALWLACAPAIAEDAAARLGSGRRAAVPDSRLALVRGGHGTDAPGLQVAIAVQRQVSVDGGALAASALHFCGGSAACPTTGGGGVLQSGAGNSAALLSVSVPGMPGGLAVQNTADQQRIQTLTTLDISANSLQLFKRSGWQDALGSALAVSARR